MEKNYLTRTKETMRSLFAGLFLFTAFAGEAQQTCTANFSHSSAANGPVVNFVSTTTGSVSANAYYYWTFGDGGTGWGATISHNYGGPGQWVACLMAIDSTTGCWNTKCDTVVVNSNTTSPCAPTVVFSLAKDTTQALNWFAFATYPPNTIAASWSWGDGNTSTGLYPSHSYTSAGTYTICVTVTVTCPNSTSTATTAYCYVGTIFKPQAGESSQMIKVNVFASGTAGIKALNRETQKLNIYPNPTSGLFIIEFGDAAIGSEKTNVYVYNMIGEIVLEKSISSGVKESIDLGKFDNGTYFVKLVSPTGYSTKMISVQK